MSQISRKIEGTATVLSSISHGGENAGTTQYLRREKVVQPDGSVAEVPIISGNALRGILRDHSANYTWEYLGRPELPLPVFDVLYSGGALAKAGSGKVLGSKQLAELRRLVPHVALFGAAGGGRIIEGRLQVGKLTPIVRQTTHLYPAPEGFAPPDMWDLLQLEGFTRRDDAKRPQLAERIAGMLPTTEPAQGALLTEVDTTDDTLDRESAQQMRYEVETLAAGTLLHWSIRVECASELVEAQLAAALASWGASGAHIGGRSATGHGRLALDAHQWVTSRVEPTEGSELAPSWHDQLASHHAEHKDEIVEALGWLA